jgi:hypothetical protein
MIGYHPKGRGTIYGLEAFVSHDSYVDKTSAICGTSHIFDSGILKQCVVRDCQISKSRLLDCALMDSILHAVDAAEVDLFGSSSRRL